MFGVKTIAGRRCYACNDYCRPDRECVPTFEVRTRDARPIAAPRPAIARRRGRRSPATIGTHALAGAVQLNLFENLS